MSKLSIDHQSLSPNRKSVRQLASTWPLIVVPVWHTQFSVSPLYGLWVHSVPHQNAPLASRSKYTSSASADGARKVASTVVIASKLNVVILFSLFKINSLLKVKFEN